MVPIAAALGHDPSSLSLSRSTIHRKRQEARKTFAEEVKTSFVLDGPIVVHWDGKILPDILGTGTVDRLPVLVSADGKHKLLGVPKLATGTGRNAADAVYNVLQQWNLEDDVQGMCFDTTSVNTGKMNGACTLLENKIGRELLWLACHHHMLEIILGRVFTLCLGPSNSPEIPLFKRFKTVWNGIVRDDYQGLDNFPEFDYFKNSTISSLTSVLNKKSLPRDDYMELIELTLLVLGHPLPKVHWRAPGPVHHARWMAKLIYALKIFLFRNQDAFHLTQRENFQLERFVKFGALLYTKNWIEAPLAVNAPAADLLFWQDMGKYQNIDLEISQTVKKALEFHLWYVSDELIGLSLFSDMVSADTKANIVENMTFEPTGRMVRGNSILLNNESTLANFATKRTNELFKKLKINESFLSLPPEEWNEIPDYIQGKQRVKNLEVVNDIAERGVKLFEEFNKLITNDEEEKQFLLQVVEANRKAIPTKATKKAMIQSVKPSTLVSKSIC